MFDIAPSELLVVGVVALIAIPPKDLPKAMRVAGQFVGRARGLARQFRSGFDEMIREAELTEMEKRWAAENERIMREHTADPHALLGEPAPVMTAQPVLSAPPPEPVAVEHPAVVAAEHGDPAPPPASPAAS